jgi:predicted Zn finger-like uncharacterized protein
MIIVCEKCETSYVVPANAVGTTGRNVKCVKCGHIWLAKASSEEVFHQPVVTSDAANKLNPIVNNSTLPAVLNTKSLMYMKIATAMMCLMIIVTAVIFGAHRMTLWSPYFDKSLALIGLYNTDNVVLEGLKIEKQASDKDVNVMLSGKVVNHSDRAKQLPNIVLTIRAKDQSKIISHNVTGENAILEPGGAHLIRNTITGLNENAEFLSVDIGNKFDLLFR